VSLETIGSQGAAAGQEGRATALLKRISGKVAGLSQERPLAIAGVKSSSISTDFTIAGNISCKGQAQFDGELKGDIECNHLTVGSNGRIIGDIKAENVVVYGTVEGAIHCTHIVLKTGANVTGDIFHNGLAIEMGASFCGRSDRLPGIGEIEAQPIESGPKQAPPPLPGSTPTRK
jgi:cytoskeletal protein CcmA (bactofilin family)